MASTETRTGFRLPWSSDHSPEAAAHEADTDAPDVDQTAPAAVGDDAEHAEGDTQTMTEPVATTEAGTVGPEPAPARRPSKFLADLTRAMRAAADAERQEMLGRFETEAKAFSEAIHQSSAGETTDLRKQADEDILGIREWSKAEIARIREATEHRISDRREQLDYEIESQAARVERTIELVRSTVTGYEADMGRFFDGLMAEEDPYKFAVLAANLPEPPVLDEASLARNEAAAAQAPVGAEAAPVPAEASVEQAQVPESADVSETSAAPEPEEAPSDEVTSTVGSTAGPAEPDGAPADEHATVSGGWPTEQDAPVLDPRVEALGLTPDFDAAEAEAAAAAEGDEADDGSSEDVPAFDDATIAARLAGLVPATPEAATDTISTQLVVSGLVSVASIAGFKRQLARLAGVRSVGVSSGPNGEFVFAVGHGSEVDLHTAIPTLPGFGARVTGTTEGGLAVSARDPETGA